MPTKAVCLALLLQIGSAILVIFLLIIQFIAMIWCALALIACKTRFCYIPCQWQQQMPVHTIA
jgi:hypothetical protein